MTTSTSDATISAQQSQEITELTQKSIHQKAASGANGNPARPQKFMFLKLGQSQFAIPLSSVREVLGLGQLSSLPNMPPYFAGLINLRGKIVSAVDLKKSLNFLSEKDRESQSKRPCIIITEVNGRLFGAIADDVIEVSAIADIQVDHAVDGMANKESFKGIIKKNGETLAPVLNLEKALRLHELIALSPEKLAA